VRCSFSARWAPIRRSAPELQKVGFTPADLTQGWALIYKACSVPQATPHFAPDAGPVADRHRQARRVQSSMFLRANAAMRRLHPEQDAFVFGDVVSDGNTTPVIAVSLFLERLDALESSPERKSSAQGRFTRRWRRSSDAASRRSSASRPSRSCMLNRDDRGSRTHERTPARRRFA